MAIYRPPRSPWRGRIIVAVLGLLIGGVVVWAMQPESEPTPEEEAAALRSGLIAAGGGLEIVAIEYAESVEDGVIVAEPEYEGALAALASSRSRYDAVRADLAAAGGAVEEIDASYTQIEKLMQRQVAEERGGSAVDALRDLLEEEGM